MTLDQIANISNIAASLAVVLSLVFIGLQLRQNAHLTRMAAAQTSAQLLSENLGRVIENPELAELLSQTGNLDVDTLTPTQMLILSNFLSISFRHYEVLHIHRRYGIFEEELWQGSVSRLRSHLDSPGIRGWWRSTRHVYSVSFAAFVDQLCTECEAGKSSPARSPSLDEVPVSSAQMKT